ncbi:hypothetical protein LRS10_13780 [Phenylobacterium sp. J426]|uniref:hypothetical protein n=1 Tax=Phenylobacterium sp. J426 TaxID=2898439 RepID=UPI0021516E50|nr:hypothetical protein [Phenylobacterium sp. J426]MCR5875163.1 hypothetical protein [Phenylobacterium sp. J426]
MKLSQFQALAAASATGLVAMRVAEAFTPYSEGDVAGFQPDEAHKLFKAKVLTLPDGVREPSVEDDEDDNGADDAEATAVVIPEEWEGLHHLTRVKLAKEITGGEIANKEAADEAIRAELARREAGPAA